MSRSRITDWVEIAQNNLLAAKRMCKTHPRSATSRAYYAAHVLLTDVLTRAGFVPVSPYETQPHRTQRQLIQRHLLAGGVQEATNLADAVMGLHKRRLDADYSRLATVDSDQAKEAIRDAVTVFALLNVEVSP